MTEFANSESGVVFLVLVCFALSRGTTVQYGLIPSGCGRARRGNWRRSLNSGLHALPCKPNSGGRYSKVQQD